MQIKPTIDFVVFAVVVVVVFFFFSLPPPQKVMVVQPTYGLTSGLSLAQLRSAVSVGLENLEGLSSFPPEWIDGDLMREQGWPGFREAMILAHSPQEEVGGRRYVCTTVD